MLTGLHETWSVDGAFRLSDIISIDNSAPTKPGHVDTHLMRLEGARSARIIESEYEAIMRRPVQLLPAEPGTLHIWGGVDRPEDGGEYWLATAPVIAWALCVDGQIRLVTTRGVNDGSGQHHGEFYVEMPGGSIQGASVEYAEPVFANREAYRAYIIAKVAAEREEAAEAAQQKVGAR